MATTYIPRPGTLAAHACAWFKANPGRKLTLSEICGRWGGTAQTATAQLGAAEDAEFLLSERVGRSDVYSAGPGLASWMPPSDSLAASAWQPAAAPVSSPPPGPPAPAKAAATPSIKRRGARLPLLDISRVQITKREVIPKFGGGFNRYAPLFDKLDEVGKTAEVPAAYRGTLTKAAIEYAKARTATHPGLKFAVRQVADSDTVLLQRIA